MEGIMKRSILVGLGLMLLAGSAFAQQPRKWYAGLDIGQTQLNRGGEDGVDLSGLDDKSTAWSVLAGYRFTRFFALEAGYTDLGEFSDQDSSSSTWGLMVNTRGILPIGKHFELDLLFGLVWMQRDLTFGSVSDDVSGTTGKFGIGFAVPVNERLAFNFEYNQYLDFALGFDDDFDLYVDDTTSYSLGVRWKF
jgi:OOP family OmpA-OmpF porin